MQDKEQNILGREGRVPPQAPEVEEAVLGSCIIEREALEKVVSVIGHREDVFYVPKNRPVFEAILTLYKKSAPVELLSVENELRNKEQLPIVGGPGYLSELTRSVSSAANVEYHCQILIEKYAKRKAILDDADDDNYAYSSDSDPYELLDRKMTHVNELSDILYRKKGSHIQDIMQETLEYIEERRKNHGIHGVPTLMPVDKYTGGWQDGDLYLLAARPSMGKSSFALKAAFNAALVDEDRHRTAVFYWNGEMKNRDLLKRRLAVEAKVNYIKMRDGKVSDKEMKRLIEAAGHLYNGDIIIEDTPGIGIHEFRAKYKQAVNEHGVGLGIVDYLQLMSGQGTFGTREQEISAISRGLKECAKETDTPIVALSQLSRKPEDRAGGEPFLSDLRESGSLEQDADGVIFLNRPEFIGKNEYKGDKDVKNKGWIKVAKMRNGMCGEFKMIFDKPFAEWKGLGGEYSDDKTDNIPRPHATIPHSLFDEEYDGNVDEDAPF